MSRLGPSVKCGFLQELFEAADDRGVEAAQFLFAENVLVNCVPVVRPVVLIFQEILIEVNVLSRWHGSCLGEVHRGTFRGGITVGSSRVIPGQKFRKQSR